MDTGSRIPGAEGKDAALFDYLKTPKIHNPWWRLMNLYAIEDRRGQLIKFRPNAAQCAFYQNLWHLNYVLKARQLGFSTFICILILDRLLFQANRTSGIIDHTLEDAKKKLAKMALAYENLDNPRIHPDTWMVGRSLKAQCPILSNNRQELSWKNGSTAYCGTSLRGGTVQYLHISELGRTSVAFPDKAREIVEGSLNALHEGGMGFIETTHEGGRSGEAYRLCKLAMEASAKERPPSSLHTLPPSTPHLPDSLTRLDFRFHFFPWWREETNVLTESVPETEVQRKYFAELAAQDITLTAEQRAWYCKKSAHLRHAMLKEHPSMPEEAFQAVVSGAIYGREIAALRAQGRICDFSLNPSRPFFTFWDIGMSDYTAVWLVQFDGREILWRAWYENNGHGAGHYAEVCRAWEARLGIRIAAHYLPHDAAQRDRGTGRTYVHYLREAGLGRVHVVPRTPDVWIGINHLRDLLARSWFHRTDCGTPRTQGGREYPDGIACLEAYHTRPQQNGALIQETPVHDESSHSASAARTLAEAHAAGLIEYDIVNREQKRKAVRVLTGLRG